MIGREAVIILERAGFVIQRSSPPYVWLARGKQRLMLDENGEIEAEVLEQLIGTSPPSSGADGG